MDDDNHRIQDVSQKHVLVQGYPLAAKAPGRKRSIKQWQNVEVPRKKPIWGLFLLFPLAADERTYRNKDLVSD